MLPILDVLTRRVHAHGPRVVKVFRVIDLATVSDTYLNDEVMNKCSNNNLSRYIESKTIGLADHFGRDV